MSYRKIALGKLGVIITGETPSTKDQDNYNGDIPFITPAELDYDRCNILTKAKTYVSRKGINSSKLLPQNSILVSCIGSLGKMGIAGSKLVTNQQINAIIFDEKLVYFKYGYYVCTTLKNTLESIAPSTTLKIVKKSLFSELKIPVPPLNEQKKIAAILDKAQSLIDKRKEAIAKLDELIQAVFLDMFGDPQTNKLGFPKGKIKDLVSEAKYGTSKKANDWEGRYPYLRMNNLTYEGFMDYSNIKYIDLDANEEVKYLVRERDLLFNRTNSKELVGKTAVYERSEPMAIAGYLIRVRTNDYGNPYYISAYLNSKHGKATLQNMCKSIVGMANINAKELQNIDILIPDRSFQDKFERKYKSIINERGIMEAQLTQLETNFNALLQRAFKGELTSSTDFEE
ncbi:restriction endonuclease subunit S [Paenibacillus thiaminolyticus]|nr:restriction endonuclease subunit S [Paenibacillus thiaminolyticus]